MWTRAAGGILLDDWKTTNDEKLAALSAIPSTNVMQMQPPTPPHPPPPLPATNPPKPSPLPPPPPPSPPLPPYPSPPPPPTAKTAVDEGHEPSFFDSLPAAGSVSAVAQGQPIKLSFAPPPPSFVDHSEAANREGNSGTGGSTGGLIGFVAAQPTLVLAFTILLLGAAGYVYSQPADKGGRVRLSLRKATVRKGGKVSPRRGGRRHEEDSDDDDDESDDDCFAETDDSGHVDKGLMQKDKKVSTKSAGQLGFGGSKVKGKPSSSSIKSASSAKGSTGSAKKGITPSKGSSKTKKPTREPSSSDDDDE